MFNPNPDLSNGETALTRRSIITGGAAGAAVAAAALVVPKTAEAAGGRPLTILVEDATFTSGVGAGLVDNFVVVGNITEVDGAAASGQYFCKGVAFFNSAIAGPVVPGSNTYVDQNFIIDGVGSIIGAGTEGPHDLAVLGGTGRWVGAAGSYTGGGPGQGPLPFGPGTILFSFNIRRG